MARKIPTILAVALAIAGCGSEPPAKPRPPDASQSTLSASPSVQVADGVAIATLTATARDAAGRPLAGRTAAFEVTGTANQLSTTEATTGADGVAAVTVASTRAEPKTAQVTIDGVQVTATATLTFVAGPPSAAGSGLAAAPGTATADGAAAVTITATVVDGHGNPVPDVAVSFGTSLGALGAPQATTDAGGIASVTLTSTVAGPATVSASLAGEALGLPQTVTFEPGPAARLAFAQSPAGVATAGDLLTPSALVVVEDAFGNRVPSSADPISLTLGGGNAAAALGGTTATVTVLGEAAFTDLSVDLTGTGYHLVATAPGLEEALSGEFAISAGAPAPATSGVAASLATQTAGEDVVLTATVRDAFGNLVEGAAVTFATAAPDATFVQPPATGADGVAAGQFTSTRAGTATVTASIAGGPAFDGTATVTFEAGPPSALASSLFAAPAAVDADGTSAITLTAVVRDAFGNAIAGAVVALSSSGDASLEQPAPTDALGEATGAIRSTAVGPQDVTAKVGAVEVAEATVTFLTLDPDGDGIPKGDDAFPQDPTRFATFATVPLPGLGGLFAAATAVNDANLVVGLSEDDSGLLTGARWSVSGSSASAPAALLPLPGNAYSAAYAVDASGAAVGESALGATATVPVLWSPGETTPVQLALGSFSSPAAALGISGGRIVGEAASASGNVAVLWADAGASPVELPTLGGDHSAAYAVSGALVVGESTLAGPAGAGRGVAWSLDSGGNPGNPVALAPLAGDVASIALGVDATGRIVGESESASGVVHAVQWTLAAPNAPVDLGSGSAQGVNARGRVAGHGGTPVGPILWDLRSPSILEGVLADPFLFAQAYGLNGSDVVVGMVDDQAFAAVPAAPETP